jgi:hypothetical protein
MVGPMQSSLNGFGASSTGELPPPPPMTPSEAFMTTQTKVLCQILQTRQQIVQQLRTMCGSRTGGWSLHCVMSD